MLDDYYARQVKQPKIESNKLLFALRLPALIVCSQARLIPHTATSYNISITQYQLTAHRIKDSTAEDIVDGTDIHVTTSAGGRYRKQGLAIGVSH